jgi:hypothetical protein
MQPTGGSVGVFVAEVAPAKRRRDAETLIALMREVSGREPELWGTIVGFGSCHYRYPTGTEGDMPLLAFAPRKAAMTVYVDAVSAHERALAHLGPHTSSVSCLYIRDLEEVDQAVLRRILEQSFAYATSGGDEHATLTVTG